MNMLPAKYMAARKALAEAVRIDEVKSIRDKAIAMHIYAMQAKDAELVADSAELKERATRRLGELMEEQRKAGKLKRGGDRKSKVSKKPLTLDAQGVDKNLADRARKAAAIPVKQFEAYVEKTVRRAVAAVEGNKAVITGARAERHREKKNQRANRETALATTIRALPQKKYGVILADPEWRFEFWSPKGLASSSADNHYPTSELEEIKQRNVASIAADDCVLWLWATVPMLPEALAVMAAWGFTYKSSFAWGKDRAGTGYWNRNKHELLLVGTCGKVPAPADGDQWESLIMAPRGAHSAKPEKFHELIEAYYPNLPKIELNRRGPVRAGWDAWGNEADLLEAAE
jgi:N6-adenosine-specific RNA methylase IME4